MGSIQGCSADVTVETDKNPVKSEFKLLLLNVGEFSSKYGALYEETAVKCEFLRNTHSLTHTH